MLNNRDTFSKYTWLRPLQKKNGVNDAKGFEEIIKNTIRIDHKPPNYTNKILEFKNKELHSIMTKYNIKLHHTEKEEKSSIIECYNRPQNDI